MSASVIHQFYRSGAVTKARFCGYSSQSHLAVGVALGAPAGLLALAYLRGVVRAAFRLSVVRLTLGAAVRLGAGSTSTSTSASASASLLGVTSWVSTGSVLTGNVTFVGVAGNPAVAVVTGNVALAGARETGTPK